MKPARERTSRPKGILFCPECDHESPSHGDWVTEIVDGCVRYSCPECGATIEARPPPH